MLNIDINAGSILNMASTTKRYQVICVLILNKSIHSATKSITDLLSHTVLKFNLYFLQSSPAGLLLVESNTYTFVGKTV